MRTNSGTFITNLHRFAEQVKREHLKQHRFIAMSLFRRVTLKSPVKSGRFRGAWAVSLQPPDPRPVSASAMPVVRRGEAIRNALSELEGLRPFSVIWLHNPMVYGPALENGSSKQAPGGFLAVSIAEVQSGLSKGP